MGGCGGCDGFVGEASVVNVHKGGGGHHPMLLGFSVVVVFIIFFQKGKNFTTFHKL